MTKPLRQKKKKIKATLRPIRHLKKSKAKRVFSTVKLETLPNEIILHVFNYLTILDLLKCGQVSKRFCAMSNVEYLWPKKFNLFSKLYTPSTLNIDFIQWHTQLIMCAVK